MIDRHIDLIADIMQATPEQLRKLLTCLDISDIADWFWKDNINKTQWNLEKDFPNVMQPWPYMWTEYKALPHMGAIYAGKIMKTIGILSCDVSKEDGFYKINDIIILENGNGMARPLGVLINKIGSDGIAESIHADINEKFITGLTGFEKKQIQLRVAILAWPLLFAKSLMHCKNIIVKEVIVNQVMQKRRIKRGKLPFYRFNTIEITPMREILRKEGQSETLGLKKALHICRGHFATYTHEAPLFGRVTGTFWKPMHVRGNKKEGIVIKDYKINPPQAAPCVK